MHETHAIETDAPVIGEYEPATQLVQLLDVCAPTAVEYVPAGQLTHVIEPEASE